MFSCNNSALSNHANNPREIYILSVDIRPFFEANIVAYVRGKKVIQGDQKSSKQIGLTRYTLLIAIASSTQFLYYTEFHIIHFFSSDVY